MAVAAQSLDGELLRLGRGVCLIKTQGGTGTGFHYGDGWIMSNAHVFQDVTDDKTMHSLISSASFTFLKEGKVEDANITFRKDGKDEDANFKMIRNTEENRITFECHKRIAFIHHRNPGRKPDNTNMDIAMIKLGIQYEGRPNLYTWEIDEEVLLKVKVKSQMSASGEFQPPKPKVEESKLKGQESQLTAFAEFFAEFQPPEPEVREEVYGIHFGGSDNNEKFVRSNITPITQATNNPVPMIYYNSSKNAFPPGSSGCPVMILSNGQYMLAGLNFAGDKKTPGKEDNRKAYALKWQGIKQYVGNKVGVSIISAIGTYFAAKSHGKHLSDQNSLAREKRVQESKDRQLPMYENMHDPNLEAIEKRFQDAENKIVTDHDKDFIKPARVRLEYIATNNHLTIYLPNEETIKRPAA